MSDGAEDSPVVLRDIVGMNLKRLREDAGLSQDDLMKAADVHRTQISKYERGKSIPAAEAQLRMVRAMGVKVDDLFVGVEWQDTPPRLILPPDKADSDK